MSYGSNYGGIGMDRSQQQQISRAEGVAALKKTLLWFGLPIFLLLSVLIWAKIAFEVVEVEANEVGVVMEQPWITPGGGMRKEVLQPGRYVMWASNHVTKLPSTPLIQKVEFDDLMTNDSTMLDFEATVTLQVYDWPAMLTKFGPNWYDINVDRQFSSMVRREIKSRNMPDMLKNSTVGDEVDAKLTTALADYIHDSGVPAKVLGISLGRAKPDPRVTAQMNETTTQQQRFITIQQETRNETERAQKEKKRAEADLAYRNSLGMSLEEYMTMEKARMWSEACKASGNCTLVPEGASVIVGK